MGSRRRVRTQPKLQVLSAPRLQCEFTPSPALTDVLCLSAGAQQSGEEGAGSKAAAGLSARITEIGAENSPTDRDSTDGGDRGAGRIDTVAVSDIWDD